MKSLKEAIFEAEKKWKDIENEIQTERQFHFETLKYNKLLDKHNNGENQTKKLIESNKRLKGFLKRNPGFEYQPNFFYEH